VFHHEAKQEVKRLGDDGHPAVLDERFKDWARRALAVRGRQPWMDLSTSVALGPAKRRSFVSPLVSPMARPSTSMRNLLTIRIARIAGYLDGIVQSDRSGAIGRVGQKNAEAK